MNKPRPPGVAGGLLAKLICSTALTPTPGISLIDCVSVQPGGETELSRLPFISSSTANVDALNVADIAAADTADMRSRSSFLIARGLLRILCVHQRCSWQQSMLSCRGMSTRSEGRASRGLRIELKTRSRALPVGERPQYGTAV